MVITIFSACSLSDQPKHKIYSHHSIAMKGYDPVSYSKQGIARVGNEISSSDYCSITQALIELEGDEGYDLPSSFKYYM